MCHGYPPQDSGCNRIESVFGEFADEAEMSYEVPTCMLHPEMGVRVYYLHM